MTGDEPAETPDLAVLSSALTNAINASTIPAEQLDEVCRTCTTALPLSGSAITLMTSDAARLTLGATGPVIAEIEQAQYDFGEGPSLTAFTSGRAALIPDLSDSSVSARWPILMSRLSRAAVAALFAFPLRFGAITIGVCSNYQAAAGMLDRDTLRFVLAALDLTTLALVDIREGGEAREARGDHRWLLTSDLRARNQVHQATGMVMAQLGVDAETAFARLRGHAFSAGNGLELTAEHVVSRRLRLTDGV